MKHTNRKRLLLLSLTTLLFFSLNSSSSASNNQKNSVPQKNIIATLDSKNFQIETSIHLDNIQSEPVYIALILDSSNSMNITNDIWDSKEQQWISRFDAASQAIQPIIDQASENTFLAIYKYDQTATRLTNGFESIHQEDGTRNTRFTPNSDNWVFNHYQFGKNGKTNLSNGLKLAYEDMYLIPEHTKRYVVIINDSTDIAQGDSQAYATALKSSQSTEIVNIGHGQQAEIWSILIGHDNNVSIGSWALDWKNTTVDTGTGDGFPNAKWDAWTYRNQNENLVESRPAATMTELHMITLSTALNPEKESTHPTTSTLYNWWNFYRDQHEENILELGNNVHYLYTMSLYDDTHVSLAEHDNIPEALNSKYTRNLTSLSENIAQFNTNMKSAIPTTISGIEFFNPSTIEISNVSFFENNNSLSTDKINYVIEDNQLKWTILNATQGNTYSIRYQASTKNNTFEDLFMGQGSYIQIGSSDPLLLQSIKLPNMQTPIETPTPTIEPTTTPVPTVAPTAIPVPTVAPTATSVPTVEPTATPVPTVNPTATPVPTVNPTATPVPTVNPTATPVPTVEPATTSTIKQGVSVFSVVQEPVTTSVNIAPPVNVAAPVNITQQNNNQLPQAAITTPNKTNTTNKSTVSQTEKIDAAETKQLKGKSLQVKTNRTAILTSPKEKAKPSAYIKQGREFKIVGATENYLAIQYKVKDGVNRKGYVSKKDVQIVSNKKPHTFST